MHDYVLYQSSFIKENLEDIFVDLDISHRLFEDTFRSVSNKDSTWSYGMYNVFSLTSPCTNFYHIYKELRNFIRSQLGENRPLWFQAWLNYHTVDQLLDRHHHEFDYHGYISIDPKKTITVFDDYVIENKIGQIYFGPGNRYHRVEALEPFDGVRTTIGFDVHLLPENRLVEQYIERPLGNFGLIPLL